MPNLRPDFIAYKDSVIDLLQDYGYSEAIKPFGIDTVIEITKYHIKESFLFQESIYRCAINIMAVMLDASKQYKQIQSAMANDDILSSINPKTTKAH